MQLKAGTCRFYADSGADVTVLKQKCITEGVQLDAQEVVAITGVTEGECLSLGRTNMNLGGLNCEVHVVPDTFPIDTDGLLGWKVFEDYGGKINAAEKRLEFGELFFPFVKEESFLIPPQSRQMVYTRAVEHIG